MREMGIGQIADLAKSHKNSFGWALSCCEQKHEEARDVLQESYLKVIDGRAVFDGRASLTTWFFSVIRFTAKERRRKRARRAALGRVFFRQEQGLNQPAPLFDAVTDQNHIIRKALAKLSARQQQILHLVFYQDMTIEDAAQIMGISLGSARTHYARGKTSLGRHLKGKDAL